MYVSLHAPRCALTAFEKLFDEIVRQDFCGRGGLHELEEELCRGLGFLDALRKFGR